MDLVSYEKKHNKENGEDNRDGGDNNNSSNFGVEGPSAKPELKMLRLQQMKNFIATMMVSLGTPMILGGDEMGRTQKGNNNAYCQDNVISWYDWSLLEKNADLYRFVKEMIAFRLRHPGFMRPEFYSGRDGNYNGIPDISWFIEDGSHPDWDDLGSCLALRSKSVKFKISDPLDGRKWVRVVDTSFPSPDDVLTPGNEAALHDLSAYIVKERSMVVLISRLLY
jgi:glycogen operon protein